MIANSDTDAISRVYECYDMETVTDSESLLDVFRLRYQVYCQERQFEPGRDGLETDQYDSISRHILLRYRPTGQAIGTARLVIPHLGGTGAGLPIEEVADLPRLRALPRPQLAEVSRFALSKELRAANASLGCLARLALIRGLVQLSDCMRLTHWCALMEPRLLRLLTTSGIHFTPIAGMVEHHGLRQPSFVNIGEMLAQMRREKPAIWDFITDSGQLWQSQLAAA